MIRFSSGLAIAVLLVAAANRTKAAPPPGPARLNLPPRPAAAATGSQFATRIAEMTLAEREKAIAEEVRAGNVPDFLRTLCPVRVTNQVNGVETIATVFVTPDYFAIGSDQDYLLMPVSPGTAQKICALADCSLPTPKVVDAIYQSATVKLVPAPIPPSAEMTTVPVFVRHNQTIREERDVAAPRSKPAALIAGHKKDVVICAGLADAPGKVAIYGWHKTNDSLIQPLYLGHSASWVDYSQCLRLVLQDALIDGAPARVRELLRDPARAKLLSNEGPLKQTEYWSHGVFDEEHTDVPIAAEVRLYINAPAKEGQHPPLPLPSPTLPGREGEDTAKLQQNSAPDNLASNSGPALLLIYALPNGNTIEQTLGRPNGPGVDWHFNIQHVAAQTRFLRQALPERRIVLACLQSAQKSWPAWRKKHGDGSIAEIVQGTVVASGLKNPELVLASHSGGGSFVFGYLNALGRVPRTMSRIVFLDSDYAYDAAARHDRKLAEWLRGAPNHHLAVFAYNDAVALLDGKHFVSESGGTWGRSQAMLADLGKSFEFNSKTNQGLEVFSALKGRLQFFLKENPEKKVLHTVQVERNGLIHGVLCGTTHENSGYEYLGERAYEKWIAE